MTEIEVGDALMGRHRRFFISYACQCGSNPAFGNIRLRTDGFPPESWIRKKIQQGNDRIVPGSLAIIGIIEFKSREDADAFEGEW